MRSLLSVCGLFALSLLLPPAIFADETHDTQKAKERVIDGRSTTEFTKVWTDGYHNFNKEVYRAYYDTLKNEQGEEIEVEVKHGPITAFHENGQKSWTGEFRHGRRVGDYLYWGEDGTKTGSATFDNGEMHDVYRQWHSDGRQMREETYDHGKLHGRARWWDTDGKLRVTGTYRHGQPWSGKFIQLETSPVSMYVVREFAEGKEVSVEKLTGNWWW